MQGFTLKNIGIGIGIGIQHFNISVVGEGKKDRNFQYLPPPVFMCSSVLIKGTEKKEKKKSR